MRIAYHCSWCLEWFTPEDAALAARGAPISDGMCDECASDLLNDQTPAGRPSGRGQLESDGTKPAAPEPHLDAA